MDLLEGLDQIAQDLLLRRGESLGVWRAYIRFGNSGFGGMARFSR